MSHHAKSEHPGLETIKRFSLRQLAYAEADAVERHVETCADCAQSLEQVTVDGSSDTVHWWPLEDAKKSTQGGIDETQTVSLPLRHPTSDDTSSADKSTVIPGPTPTRTFATFDLGQYEILDVIGRGGMGRVYKARHKAMGRIVALKTVLTGAHSSDAAARRFQEEAESAARLDHAAIVPVYEFGQACGEMFFTMAFVEGQSLAQRIKSQPIDARQAAYYVQQSALATHFAHQRGVVHRDIKPGNILLDRVGNVLVTDFGLARRLDADGADFDVADDFPFPETHETVCRLTQTGMVMGTPAYMAPEQALDSKKAGPPADIWALGAVLYACLTGRPPFEAANVMETLTLVIEADPLSPRSLNPAVSFDLEAICIRCLQKEESARYASAAELADDLGRWLNGRTPLAARLTWYEWVRRFDADYPETVPIALGTLALCVAPAQEAIFVAIAIAATRLEGHAASWVAMIRSAVTWGALCAAGPVRELLQRYWDFSGVNTQSLNPSELRYEFELLRSVYLSALAGILLGTLLSTGRETVAQIKPWLTWIWNGSLLLGIGCWLVFFVLGVNFRQHVESWHPFSRDGIFRDESFLPSLLLVVPLAVSCGAAIALVERRVARFQGVRGQWARFLLPIVAGVASLAVLVIAAILPTSPTVVLLDVNEYYGPGPLLAQVEQRFRDATHLDIMFTWTVVFFGKFCVIAAAMGLSVSGAAWFLRERAAE